MLIEWNRAAKLTASPEAPLNKAEALRGAWARSLAPARVAGLRAATRLPPPVTRRLAGDPVLRNGSTLDPDCQLILRASAGTPPLNSLGVEPSRAMIAQAARQGRAGRRGLAAAVPLRLDGAAAALPARWYAPLRTPPTGAMLLYFHGGGFVLGDLDTHEDVCLERAHSTGACVLSVEYRLAPEHRFPAQLEDARAAFASARRLALTLTCDPERIGVAGDSAGGNLAAALAAPGGTGDGRPICQLLIYPWLDMSLTEPSVSTYADAFGLRVEELRWFRELWLGADAAQLWPASPTLTSDLRGACPAVVVIAGFDPLCDEAEHYAQRLTSAGVSVTVQHHPGLIHGFVEFLGLSRTARDAVTQLGAAAHQLLAAQPSR